MQNRLVNESFMVKTTNVRDSDLSIERRANKRLQEQLEKEHER